jgi:uncharacterized membrane protein YkoI
MHKVCVLSVLLFAFTIAGTGVSAAAEPITKQQAATIAKSQFPGRVISVDESKRDNTTVYRVKVLDKKGGMHTIVIDHQSGSVLSAH